MSFIKANKIALFICLVFAVVFGLISLVNHYNLRTYAWDLGLYNHAIYQYAHLVLNKSTLLEPYFPNRFQLGDHFDLLLILVSPLYYVFGSNTLLIVQIVAILFGGFGIFKFVREVSNNKYLPYLALLHFFGMWGIYAALSFDYHSNVVAAMFIPWLFLSVKNGNKQWLVIFVMLALICKENVALYLFFILIGLWWLYFNKKELRLLLPALAGFCLVYFYVVVFKIMPKFSPATADYIHFEFSDIGQNFSEALNTIITKPVYAFALLFQDIDNRPELFGIKAELHFFVLLSGGFALFYKPQLALMVLVLYAQKLYHNDFTKWGIVGQYSIEFAPIISLAFFIFIKDFSKRWQLFGSAIIIISTYALTYYSFNNPYSKWQITERINLFEPKHYHQDFDTQKVIKLLKQVPADIKVSCSANLAPHLAFRDSIYLFPFTGNANLIVLLDKAENHYPLPEEQFNEKITAYNADSNWVNCYQSNNLIVYRKKDLSFCFNN